MSNSTKVVCNLDSVTHVIINGKEYERKRSSDKIDEQEADGQCILLGLPLQNERDKPTDKYPKGFPFWARIGSKWGGKPMTHNGLRVDFYPLANGVTKTKNETCVSG